MRKFFIAFSIIILILLISTGIHQKINDSDTKNIKGQELGVIYSNNNLK